MEAYVGSSNLTQRGLAGHPPAGNIELSVKILVTSELIEWCNYLRQQSVLVDDRLFEAIEADVSSYLKSSDLLPPTRRGFSERVIRIINQGNQSRTLYLFDLPRSSSPLELCEKDSMGNVLALHDLQVLGLPRNPSIDQIKTAFRLSPGFTWLSSRIETSKGFGALTADLHNDLCDEPKPYRSEVKERLASLIRWTADLFPSEFIVKRPRYREVIERVVK